MTDNFLRLEELRSRLDKTDEHLVLAFAQRMELVRRISEEKAALDAAVHDPSREEKVLSHVTHVAPPELCESVTQLYEKLFEISRNYQCDARNTKGGL